MEPVPHFRRLFAYDHWANREILSLLPASAPVRSVELMGHIISAKRLWLERIVSKAQTLAVWPKFDMALCHKEGDEVAAMWAHYFLEKTTDDLEKQIRYKNTRGEAFSSHVEDILTHVIAHGTYHRGQIAADMRAAGVTPAYTDFIHCIRQGFVE